MWLATPQPYSRVQPPLSHAESVRYVRAPLSQQPRDSVAELRGSTVSGRRGRVSKVPGLGRGHCPRTEDGQPLLCQAPSLRTAGAQAWSPDARPAPPSVSLAHPGC